jgi:hypothetical protein
MYGCQSSSARRTWGDPLNCSRRRSAQALRFARIQARRTGNCARRIWSSGVLKISAPSKPMRQRSWPRAMVKLSTSALESPGRCQILNPSFSATSCQVIAGGPKGRPRLQNRAGPLKESECGDRDSSANVRRLKAAFAVLSPQFEIPLGSARFAATLADRDKFAKLRENKKPFCGGSCHTSRSS